MKEAVTQVQTPDVFEAENAADFLRSVITELQARAPQAYSLRSICRRAGIKSCATLTLILQNKRVVSEPISKRLADAVQLTGLRRRYFMTLAALSRAESPDEKFRLQEVVFSIRSQSKASLLDVEQYRFFANWYYPVLYLLFESGAKASSPGALAKRFREIVSLSDIERALRDMAELGLIKRDGERIDVVRGALMKTGEDIRNASLRKFHRDMILMAAKAMELPPETREITCLTVTASKRLLPKLKERIRQFREEFDELIAREKSSDDEEEVFQLNVQLFPITKKTEGNS